MERGQRNKIVFFSMLVCMFGVGLGVWEFLTLQSEAKSKSVQEDEVLGTETSLKNAPYITSVAPTVGYEGQNFSYKVTYSDSDSSKDDIVISLQTAPSWLSVNGMEISGIPPVGSSGQYKMFVKISDGVNSSVQENYILIKSNEN